MLRYMSARAASVSDSRRRRIDPAGDLAPERGGVPRPGPGRARLLAGPVAGRARGPSARAGAKSGRLGARAAAEGGTGPAARETTAGARARWRGRGRCLAAPATGPGGNVAAPGRDPELRGRILDHRRAARSARPRSAGAQARRRAAPASRSVRSSRPSSAERSRRSSRGNTVRSTEAAAVIAAASASPRIVRGAERVVLRAGHERVEPAVVVAVVEGRAWRDVAACGDGSRSISARDATFQRSTGPGVRERRVERQRVGGGGGFLGARGTGAPARARPRATARRTERRGPGATARLGCISRSSGPSGSGRRTRGA